MCFFLPALGLGGAVAGGTAAAGATTAAATLGAGSLSSGFGIFGQLLSFVGQIQQMQAQKDQIAAEAKRAQQTLNETVAQHQHAFESEKDKAQGDKAGAAIKGYAAASKATAMAAESGVVGLSVRQFGDAIEQEADTYGARVDKNIATQGAQHDSALRMAQRRAAARVASLPPPQQPNFFGLVAGIGKTILQGATKPAGAPYPYGRYG